MVSSSYRSARLLSGYSARASRMYNHRGGWKRDDGRPSGKDVYNCSTYFLSREHETKACFSHSISSRVLNELLLETIRVTASYAIENREEFAERVHSVSAAKQQETVRDLKSEVRRAKARIDELNVLIKKLYEGWALGRLDEKRFEILLADYEREQEELEETVNGEQAELDRIEADAANAENFLSLAEKYTDFTELTPAMISEFVDKILVHGAVKSPGLREQEVEIHLRFIGRFEVPMPEPTPEELAAAEAAEAERRRKSILNHERYLKQKDRRKKIASGEIIPHTPFDLVCRECGAPFQAQRSNAAYCSDACRKRAKNARKKAARDAKALEKAAAVTDALPEDFSS